MVFKIPGLEKTADNYLDMLRDSDVVTKKFAAIKLRKQFASDGSLVKDEDMKNNIFATQERLDRVLAAFESEKDNGVAKTLVDIMYRAQDNDPNIKLKPENSAVADKAIDLALSAIVEDESFSIRCLFFAGQFVEFYPQKNKGALATRMFDEACMENEDLIRTSLLRLGAMTYTYLPDDPAMQFLKFATKFPTLAGSYALELFGEAVSQNPPLLEHEGIEKDLKDLAKAQNPFVRGKAIELLCFAGVLKGEPDAFEAYQNLSKRTAYAQARVYNI